MSLVNWFFHIWWKSNFAIFIFLLRLQVCREFFVQIVFDAQTFLGRFISSVAFIHIRVWEREKKPHNWCALNINVAQMMMWFQVHLKKFHFDVATTNRICTSALLTQRPSRMVSLHWMQNTYQHWERTQSTLHGQSTQQPQHLFSVVLYAINGILCDIHVS